MKNIIAILLAACFSASAFAGSITLRSAVRLPADATQVRLADIAEIEGTEAERFSDVVIAELDDPTKAVEIPIRQVRAALDEAGIHWGRASLTGRSVTVRPRRSGAVSPPMAMNTAAVQGAQHQRRERERETSPRHVSASDLVNRPTVRGAIASYIARGLGVAPSELRLNFDDRHREFLDTPAGEMRFEIEPVSNLRSSRIDLTVRVWIDGLIDHRRTVSVEPMVNMNVVTVAEEIRREEMIRAEHLKLERQWLTPNQPGLVTDMDDVIGRHSATRLRSGDVLRTNHLRREMLIRRGEHVIVRCLVGSAVISLQAEARAEGGEGDVIEFRKLGERDTFLATVTGRNEAIVDLTR